MVPTCRRRTSVRSHEQTAGPTRTFPAFRGESRSPRTSLPHSVSASACPADDRSSRARSVRSRLRDASFSARAGSSIRSCARTVILDCPFTSLPRPPHAPKLRGPRSGRTGKGLQSSSLRGTVPRPGGWLSSRLWSRGKDRLGGRARSGGPGQLPLPGVRKLLVSSSLRK